MKRRPFVVIKYQYNFFRTKEQEDKKANWRDSFLIERGKMTTDRYNKIRNALPPVAIDFSWSIKTPY